MNQKQIKAAVEAMLFAAADPVGADKLAQALQLPQAAVESALEELRTRCQREDSGLCLPVCLRRASRRRNGRRNHVRIWDGK